MSKKCNKYTIANFVPTRTYVNYAGKYARKCNGKCWPIKHTYKNYVNFYIFNLNFVCVCAIILLHPWRRTVRPQVSSETWLFLYMPISQVHAQVLLLHRMVLTSIILLRTPVSANINGLIIDSSQRLL